MRRQRLRRGLAAPARALGAMLDCGMSTAVSEPPEKRRQALQKDADFPLNGAKCGIALSWDNGNNGVDLDLQAVAFSAGGRLMDAVYYNNLKALGRGITHSGDEVTGERRGFDEIVWVHFQKLPEEAELIVFVVASYKGGLIREAVDGKFHVLEDVSTNELGNFSLGRLACQASVVGFFHRTPGGWACRVVEEQAGQGQHFIDILEPTIGGIVRSVIPGAPKRIKASFAMGKGSVVDLPKNNAMRQTCAGLAWDSGLGEVDLDVSAILIDASGKEVDTVFFGSQESQGIRHSGDNVTGGGDAEVISLDLDGLASEVQQIVFVINIYSKDKTFKDVQDPRCRIFTREGSVDGEEICHYRLAEATEEEALIIARLFRAPGDVRWGFQAIGAPCKGRTYKDSLPEVMKYAATAPSGLLRSSTTASMTGPSLDGPYEPVLEDVQSPEGHCGECVLL